MAVAAAPLAIATEPELPTQAKVLDSDILFGERPIPTISPNGRWVAYVSKGYVCICNVVDPKPLKLFDVPNSWTRILSRPEYANTRGDSGALFRALGKEAYQKLSAEATSTIADLHWTHDSKGVVFGVQSNATDPKKSSYNVWQVAANGQPVNLSHADSDSPTAAIGHGILTRDRRFLVAPGYPRALIWDVAANRPRATPFLTLVPSATSGRWIGVEKDTRQLVIVNENFEVIKRFEVFRPSKSYGFKLEWSPNERFIIWRNQIGFDHYSNWEGFWMDLDTGNKRELDGRYLDERFAFTGRDGEFYRGGQTGMRTSSYDAVVGAHLTIVPGDQSTPPQDVWRLVVDRSNPIPGMLTNRPGNPPVRANHDGNLFAIGLPRAAGERSGCFWHLMARDGTKWRFPGKDNDVYISPFNVVGFAEDGKSIVAYDNSRLFSLPVSSIQSKVP
jgi:hypothetical protein